MKQSRLKDRGVIKGIPDYRKRVYRVTDTDISYVKIQIVDPRYRPLFEKNIDAISFCKKNGIKVPEILEYSSEEMIIHYQDVGENVMGIDNKLIQAQYIQQGIQELFKLHSSSPIEKKYYPNSYIEKFIGISILEENAEEIYRLLDEILSVEWRTTYGPGVSDPTPSNMCYDSTGGVYLIDFDNFTMEVSFFESLGFVVGDYLFKSNILLSRFSDLEKIIENWGIDGYLTLNQLSKKNEHQKEFWLGFLSVYLTLYQDVSLGIPKSRERLFHFSSNIQFGINQLHKL